MIQFTFTITTIALDVTKTVGCMLITVGERTEKQCMNEIQREVDGILNNDKKRIKKRNAITASKIKIICMN